MNLHNLILATNEWNLDEFAALVINNNDKKLQIQFKSHYNIYHF